MLRSLVGLACVTCMMPAARAQLQEFKLDPEGSWKTTRTPEPGSDEAVIAEARKLLAEDKPSQARRMIDEFIERVEGLDNPWMAEALLIRGDALTLEEDEFEALYDYERIIKEFPASDAYAKAVEREVETSLRYLNGYNRKWWFGFRWQDATDVGEELLIRAAERLPGSRVAERAMIELADYYYRERELKLAAETYDLFLLNFPISEHRDHAMKRRVYSNIGRFKGPRYDSAGLVEAQALIEDFQGKFPAEADKAGLNEAMLVRLDESAAAAMLETADWYIKRKDRVAARYTLQRLLAKHPATAAAEKGLAIMLERGWIKEPTVASGADNNSAATAASPSGDARPAEAAR